MATLGRRMEEDGQEWPSYFGKPSGGLRLVNSATWSGEPKPMMAEETAGCDSAKRTATSGIDIRPASVA